MESEKPKQAAAQIFLVGQPRSGTKLLTGLLNNNSRLQLLWETNCLPYWWQNWARFGDLSDFRNFSNFYKDAFRIPFFEIEAQLGRQIPCEEWHRSCRDYSVGGVFEAMARWYTGVAEGSGMIWGDKSPTYLPHVALLKEIFPQCRIIHIVRDVRDQCLSLKKTFGKNMVRGAQFWVDRISVFQRASAPFKDDLLELRYEDLLLQPREELTRLCDFVGVEFEDSMMQVNQPKDRWVGPEKGKNSLLRDNTQKYLRAMDPKTRHRIESIAASKLREFGYPVDSEVKPSRINRVESAVMKVQDGIELLRFQVKLRGISKGFSRWIRNYRYSGNRIQPYTPDTDL